MNRKGRDTLNKWQNSILFLPFNFGDSEQHTEFFLGTLS